MVRGNRYVNLGEGGVALFFNCKVCGKRFYDNLSRLEHQFDCEARRKRVRRDDWSNLGVMIN